MAAERRLVYVPLDGRLEIERLAALATEFDSIEPGAAYPASEFVTWIRREVEHRRAAQAAEHQRLP